MTPTATWDDLITLAQTIRGEARGEPFEGQLAVGWVIRNRSRVRNMAIRDVCLQPFQFSCWNTADPNLRVLASVSFSDPSFIRALGVAGIVISGGLPDLTGAADHYHTLARPENAEAWPPSWAANMTPTVRVSSHQFYRST